MHAGRNTAAVVDHNDAAVDLERDLDGLAEARHMFVDAVIDDLVDQMVKAFDTSAADVHCRTLANGIQPFENFNLVRAIAVRLTRFGAPVSGMSFTSLVAIRLLR